MAVEFNIDGDIANQKRNYQIEGETYKLHTYWLPIVGWCVSVLKEDGTPLISGITLPAEQINLTWRYSRLGGLFSGDLFLLNKNSKPLTPLTSDNFGQEGDWNLFYLTLAEMETFGIVSHS